MSSGRAQRARLAIATVLASALWIFFVANAGWLWAPMRTQPVAEPPLDMKLVELAAPAAAAADTAHLAVAPQKPAAIQQHVRERVAHRPAVTRATVPPTPAPERQQQAAPPSATPQSQQETKSAAQAAEPSTASSAATSSSSANLGNAAARPLSQPLPDLPDDLREDGYRATAIARFTIHADGSADVELIRPTPMPRLNQILLDTLHQWRFAPAIENGRPVESRQDVRVHFNVS
ncbi:energy transducer TonB [Paraburkholderia caballeronis]|uniref:Protein TonB n=1 Tax=Paraburkholderia caballeronis TaxID=416943 RepID=A0A1H7S4E2_9BURK|nr:energy transducer TonB [Paraburkholderia caballeronis]PXW22881.1 protein TonB [Paraburkholderia caballeronis]PXW97266.1 protein TonB [Paraburkholderia caballeronis]RAJ93786.1 protein TonB [Paraburkholderia caballeronis]SED58616.1 protein TonB [Paraburkholderia caballeronis]SEL67490.1 protein TonB [Paraburkholderia caballeronis]